MIHRNLISPERHEIDRRVNEYQRKIELRLRVINGVLYSIIVGAGVTLALMLL